MHYIFLVLISFFGVSWSFYTLSEETVSFPKNTSYDFQTPSRTILLPSSLNEISGITLYNDTTLACVQDEKGKIYFLNLLSEEIDKELKFEKKGDYEDISFAKNKLYVLRSDGDIFKVKNLNKEHFKVKKYETRLKSENDTEGLCYDKDRDQLLVLCKEKPGSGNKQKTTRAVYAFDLEEKESSKKPVLKIDIKDILKFTGNKAFKPAAIAIHPVTKTVYIVDSVGGVLIQLSRDGQILSLDELPKNLLPQPEGMVFDEKGRLYVSTEQSSNIDAKILRFDKL